MSSRSYQLRLYESEAISGTLAKPGVGRHCNRPFNKGVQSLLSSRLSNLRHSARVLTLKVDI